MTRYLLPAAAYNDDSWFRTEQEQLFERTWAFVGVEHDLAEPGDFLTSQVGRAPIVVVRTNDGQLRAFHNICRHRGLPLLNDSGNCGKAIVCPYHRWNYSLEGQLRAVPQRDEYPELDFDDLGLHPVRCEVWKTLVFVHLDYDASPLTEWIGDFDALFDNFDPEQLVEVSHQRHEVKSNWKLYVENHVDWLHLWYLHDESLGGYDHVAGERLALGRHWASFERWTPETRRWAADPANADEVDSGLLPIPGLDERDRSNGAHFIFPALTLFTNDDYWMLGQVVPIGPGSFRLHLRVFAMAGSDGARFEPIVNRVMFEDYSTTEAIQQAVASPAFQVGPLTTEYEREIMRFHEHYLEHVTHPN